MKTFTNLLAILLLLTFGVSGQMQANTGFYPSETAKAGFHQHFPAATQVKWENENGDLTIL